MIENCRIEGVIHHSAQDVSHDHVLHRNTRERIPHNQFELKMNLLCVFCLRMTNQLFFMKFLSSPDTSEWIVVMRDEINSKQKILETI